MLEIVAGDFWRKAGVNHRSTTAEATDFMMRQVAALLPEAYRGAYGAGSEGQVIFARQAAPPADNR